MSAFTKTADGYGLRAGAYAIVATGWNGDAADPRSDDPQAGLGLPDVTEPTVCDLGGIEALVLPMGRDVGGAIGRVVAIGPASIAAFGRIAVIPFDEARRRTNRFAPHIEDVVPFHAAPGAEIVVLDDCYTMGTEDDFVEIDRQTPGAFSIEAQFVDMSDPDVARAFDYGSDAFNAGLDEHGFFCDVDAVRRRCDGMDGPAAARVRNMLPATNAYAHYAPVQG